MASDDDSQALDTHHDERDWEEQKENFRVCYIDKNMTRKESADYMKEHFNFNATPRQWERKIKQWNFSKYMGREERLAQIAQTGKTVQDVSRPGRRPRSHVDEQGNLQPHEDRNLRRFARREVSRSRSRSRSASFTDRPSPPFKQEFSDPSPRGLMDAAFDFNEMGSEMQRTPSNGGFHVAGTQARSEPLQPFQPAFFQSQQPGAYGTNNEPSIALNVVHNQWAQRQHDSTQQFNAAAAQNQYDAFATDPITLHASQGLALQSANQPFSGITNSTSFGFPMTDSAMPTLPAGFNQFAMPGDTMRVHPGMLPEDLMTEQAMFDNTMQLPQGSNTLDQADFENNPMITFDLVDMDSTAMLPSSGALPQQPQAGMAVSPLEQPLSDDGPLRNDVLPLVEHYTRAVQAVALGALNGASQDDGLSIKLAADLLQPSRAFMASMAVFLDNFTKTQQRSLQSMKNTCSKLRQKNAVLEQILNSSTEMDPVASIETIPNRSSVPPQTAMYGNMYVRDF